MSKEARLSNNSLILCFFRNSLAWVSRSLSVSICSRPRLFVRLVSPLGEKKRNLNVTLILVFRCKGYKHCFPSYRLIKVGPMSSRKLKISLSTTFRFLIQKTSIILQGTQNTNFVDVINKIGATSLHFLKSQALATKLTRSASIGLQNSK